MPEPDKLPRSCPPGITPKPMTPREAIESIEHQTFAAAVARDLFRPKRIFVCSPLRGDYTGNTLRARGYCAEVAEMGHIPYAPHLLFPQFLDDTLPEQRERGIAMGLAELALCDELWAWVPPSGSSEGMAAEIDAARELGLPARVINVPEPEHWSTRSSDVDALRAELQGALNGLRGAIRETFEAILTQTKPLAPHLEPHPETPDCPAVGCLAPSAEGVL